MLPETPDELLEWNLDKLWTAINQIEEIKQETKDKVKNGIRIEIPIWYITQNWYEIYPISKTVKVIGHGKYKIKDFMEETEERKKIIIKELLESMDETGATTPRGE